MMSLFIFTRTALPQLPHRHSLFSQTKTDSGPTGQTASALEACHHRYYATVYASLHCCSPVVPLEPVDHCFPCPNPAQPRFLPPKILSIWTNQEALPRYRRGWTPWPPRLAHLVLLGERPAPWQLMWISWDDPLPVRKLGHSKISLACSSHASCL